MLNGKVRAMLVIASIFTSNSCTSVSGIPHTLAPGAACQLAKSDKIPGNAIYSIQGIYRDDGEQGAELEVPACDRVIWPKFDDKTLAIDWRYHFAFKDKCGGTLIGDFISGVFTGKFIAGTMQTQWGTIPVNIFIISSIESKNLDIASITCPKS